MTMDDGLFGQRLRLIEMLKAATFAAHARLQGLTYIWTRCLPARRIVARCDDTVLCVDEGGLATTLNEIAAQSGVGMLLDEARVPVAPQVEAACELLGLDPLYVANEGGRHLPEGRG